MKTSTCTLALVCVALSAAALSAQDPAVRERVAAAVRAIRLVDTHEGIKSAVAYERTLACIRLAVPG